MPPILKLTLCLLPYIVVSLAVGAYQKCIEITREPGRECTRLVVIYIWQILTWSLLSPLFTYEVRR